MSDMYYEKASISLIYGTEKKIESLINKYPDRWNNKSQFIRSAIAKYIREL